MSSGGTQPYLDKAADRFSSGRMVGLHSAPLVDPVKPRIGGAHFDAA